MVKRSPLAPLWLALRHSVPPVPHRLTVVLACCAPRAQASGLLKRWQVTAARTTVALALALSACGGRQWPGATRALGDPAFVSAERTVERIDVLPVDLQ